MDGRQPKPAAQSRHEKQVMQQVPKPKLTIVFTLDGVTAEPLLTYQNKRAGPRLGKTTFTPSAGGDPAYQRHQAHVGEAVRTLVPNLPGHEEAIHHAQQERGPHPGPERNPDHERER